MIMKYYHLVFDCIQSHHKIAAAFWFTLARVLGFRDQTAKYDDTESILWHSNSNWVDCTVLLS
jgi:hypothetical protein